MKKTTVITALLLGASLAAVAAPQIDKARLDAAAAQTEARSVASGVTLTEEQRKQMREQLLKELQRAEAVKNEALKAGLDKDPTVRNQFKNFEAQFYAAQYVEYLRANAAVDEDDLRRIYKRWGREVKMQTAVFESETEAREALARLRKGLSFTALLKTLSNQPETPEDFFSPRMLPSEISAEIDAMAKGQISARPIFFQGAYYLFKLTDSRTGKLELPPFDELKETLRAQAEDEVVRAKIQGILKDNGLE